MATKGKALVPRKLKCSKCGKTVVDTVITRHMWRAHRADMMANRGGRRKKPTAEQVAKQLVIVEANKVRFAVPPLHPDLRLTYEAADQGTLKVTLWQGDCHLVITDVTKIEVCE